MGASKAMKRMENMIRYGRKKTEIEEKRREDERMREARERYYRAEARE